MRMGKTFTVSLPLFVGGRPKKNGGGLTNKHWLNLNKYRNLHYQTLNGTKKQFKEDIKDQVEALPNLSELFGTIRIDYVCYLPNAVKRDIGNIVGVVDKYFCDAVVELGKLVDDNWEHIKASSWVYGGIDRDRPRLEATIRRYEEE